MRTSLLSPALLAGLLAGSGLLLRAAACAEDAPPPKETQFFEALDRDRDGKVTTEEFTAAGKDLAAFPLLDRNKDGAITPDELGLPADYKPAPRPAGKDGPGRPGQPGGAGGKAGAGGAGGGELRRRLKEMDADQDGRVTKDEWTGEAEVFARLDRNQDGVLDGPEMAGGMGGGKGDSKGGRRMDVELIKQRWAQMDTDGDGKVSPEEYKGELPFERIDLDKDGFLTEADLKALTQGQGGPGGPGGPGGMGMPEPSPEQIAKQFADLDKDGSGKLEAAELPEPARERALKADEDGDGALSQEEFAKGLKKLRRPGGRAGGPGAGPGGPGSTPGGPGAGGGGPDLLRRFDHDRDGKVTRDQFPGSDEQFAKLDTNADGVLTADDFPAPPAPQPAPAGGKLAALDKDGDGRLCRPEWPGSDEEWRALDKNTDGWVTADELEAK